MKESLPEGSRLTKQRSLILEMVRSMCYHPTAEEIYRQAKRQIPKISIGTVYRNLDYLTNHHFIKRLDIPGQPARYDSDIKAHCHFISEDKNCIYDLPIDTKKVQELFEHEDLIDSIHDVHIMIYGTSRTNSKERKMRKGKLKIKA